MTRPSPTANAQDVTANPFAFPFPAERNSWGDGIREGSDGMELRDYFACNAPHGAFIRGSGPQDPVKMAKAAYVYADAMLAARVQVQS